MRSFEFEAHIPRTVLGRGTITQIPHEVHKLGASRVLLVTESTDRQLKLAGDVQASLGSRCVGICAEAVMHTPEDVTVRALEQAKSHGADSLVSIGGGSTIGLGKALGIRLGVPHIAVPTTYAGSEATPILGETVNNVKTTRKDPRILPNTIIYDVDLTLSLPQHITYTSGINAIAHCVEALYSAEINPVIEGVARNGIRQLHRSLSVLRDSPDDLSARRDAIAGAWAAGICLGHVGMGLHHKLCHTLGGSFGLDHSKTHTVILPHAMAYNHEAAADVMDSIRIEMGSESSAARAMWDFEKELGTVQSLKELGMREEDLEKAADLACQAQYPNPAPLVKKDLLELLHNAYYGRRPD